MTAEFKRFLPCSTDELRFTRASHRTAAEGYNGSGRGGGSLFLVTESYYLINILNIIKESSCWLKSAN